MDRRTFLKTTTTLSAGLLLPAAAAAAAAAGALVEPTRIAREFAYAKRYLAANASFPAIWQECEFVDLHKADIVKFFNPDGTSRSRSNGLWVAGLWEITETADPGDPSGKVHAIPVAHDAERLFIEQAGAV